MIAYIIIFSGVINFILGLIVAFGAHKQRGKVPFVLFSLATFFWALSDFFIYESGQPIFVKLAYSIAALIPTFLLSWIFSLDITEKRKKFKQIVIFSAGLIFLILPLINSLIITNIRPDAVTGTTEDAGLFYPVYMAFFMFAFLAVVVKLAKDYKASVNEEKKRYAIILTGFIIYGAGSILFGLVLPMLGFADFTNFDVPSSLIFVAFTTYAIVQYKWMNLKVVAVQFLAVLIVGIALFEVFLADTVGQRIYKSISFLVLTTLSVLIVRSVLNEINRKDELQLMSDKLAQANDQLRKLDNAKSEFISIASHQLRTPLTAIKGFISLMLEGSYGKMAPEQVDVLNKVYSSNERLVNLVEDLLNISRIESGRMEFQFDKWKIEDICQEVIDTFVLRAKEHKLYLEYKKPDQQLPELIIDGVKVREVISNLVDNAIKYTLEGKGGVTLKVEQRGESIRVTISDTGIGIPESELPYLFAKFSRGKDTSRLNTGGTGLGLYVGKTMIENNGGKIWAESDGQGLGSRFIIELPIVKRKEEAEERLQKFINKI